MMSSQRAGDFPPGVLVVSAISCCLSIAGGLAIVLTYWRIRRIRNFTRKLLVCLTIADLLTAAGYLFSVGWYATQGRGCFMTPWFEVSNETTIPVQTELCDNQQQHGQQQQQLQPATPRCQSGRSDPLCRIQSCLTTFSSMASFFWTLVIAAHIHRSTVCQSRHEERTCLVRVVQLVCWLLPGFITLVAVGHGVLGGNHIHPNTTGPWCWIDAKSDKEAVLWMTLSGKGWEILCYLLTTALYVHLKYYMYKNRHRGTRLHEINVRLRDEDRNFLYVWLVLYLLRMWGTIRFFVNLRNVFGSRYIEALDAREDIMTVLLYFQAGGDPAQGFSNFILFCCADETVRQEIIRSISGHTDRETNGANLAGLDLTAGSSPITVKNEDGDGCNSRSPSSRAKSQPAAAEWAVLLQTADNGGGDIVIVPSDGRDSQTSGFKTGNEPPSPVEDMM